MKHSKLANISKHAGFTLVELLIVVVILAILAGILVPQFSSATDDAKMSSLDSNLSNTRSAVELYYQQPRTLSWLSCLNWWHLCFGTRWEPRYWCSRFRDCIS